jgi:triosephosphate isomerase
LAGKGAGEGRWGIAEGDLGMIIINFKNYVSGKKAADLSKRVERYLGKSAIVCPAMRDIEEVSGKVRLKVYSQYVEKDFVAKGSLLNHSDHRITAGKIGEVIKKGRGKIRIILCVKNVGEAKKYRELKPWAIAFEDEKLIGSGKSITTYQTEAVKGFVSILKGSGVIPLCGAGISSVGDVLESKRLGCKGVLIASAIVKDVKKGEKFLKELRKV